MCTFLTVSQDAFPQIEDCERGPEPMPTTALCHSLPSPVCAVKWHPGDLARLSLTLSAALIEHLGCPVSCLPRPKSLQVFPRCEKALATRHMGTEWLLSTLLELQVLRRGSPSHTLKEGPTPVLQGPPGVGPTALGQSSLLCCLLE